MAAEQAALMMHLLLAVLLAQTQSQMNQQAYDDALKQRTAMNQVYSKATAVAPNKKALTRSQARWQTFIDATCRFYGSMVEGGSIQPMIVGGCYRDITASRTAWLKGFVARHGHIRNPIAVDPKVDAALTTYYGKLANAILPAQKPLLLHAEQAWIAFRDATCPLQGGTCIMEMERAQLTVLKNSWIAEPL